MKILKKTHKIAGQSNDYVRKPQKHDANLRKNSGLYFQIGLILCLLATYGLFEMKFENKTIAIYRGDPDDNIDDFVMMTDFTIHEETVAKVENKPKVKVSIVKPPIIIEQVNPTITETAIAIKPTSQLPIIDGPMITKKKPEPIDDRARRLGELSIVPIYPGCENETTNQARVQCMSDKLGQLVKRKFNTDIAAEYGLSGIQKISVEFKIDKTGHIVDIKIRAPHQVLEREAERLALKIPTMIPGKQAAETVSVLYNLPITFMVNN